jgi:hypothetical protein
MTTHKTTLTLGLIRQHSPCESGWRKLTKALGTTDTDTVLSIGDIVLSNGLDDALWALRCLPPREAVAAVMLAVKRAAVHTTDQRVHECIAAVDRWIAGDDSVDLKAAAALAARAEAWAQARALGPARSAAGAVWAAVWAAVGAALARAARAAEEGTSAAGAGAAERDMQAADLLVMFPPIRMKQTGEAA